MMHKEKTRIIGVVAISGPRDISPLFELLGSVFPVHFEARRPGDFTSLDAIIWVGSAGAGSAPSLPSLQIPEETGERASSSGDTFEFTHATAAPAILRGRSVRQQSPIPVCRMPALDGADPILCLAGQPVWSSRKGEDGRTDLSAMPLPPMEEKESLFDLFCSRNFVQLVPVIDFLRRVCGEDAWNQPPPRACFMFDDPNLHTTGYGWLRYGELVRHASAYNYHASFAIIPLDVWFASKRSVQFFVGDKPRLSLLMHGNNHIRWELASFSSAAAAASALAQALKRISHFESRTGVEVSRVMAAPHGACSAQTLEVMAQLGFEAACISHGSLRHHNANQPWTRSLGLRMSETVSAMPVIPRFRMAQESTSAILLAAYLNQPIIPIGHHENVADGLGVLKEQADFINSLPGVQWMDLKSIARSNYQTRQDGDGLRIRSFARTLQLRVPPGVRQLSLETAWPAWGGEEEVHVQINARGNETRAHLDGAAIEVKPGMDVRIALVRPDKINPQSVREPAMKFWTVARRQICEVRDRLSPIPSRLVKGWVK